MSRKDSPKALLQSAKYEIFTWLSLGSFDDRFFFLFDSLINSLAASLGMNTIAPVPLSVGEPTSTFDRIKLRLSTAAKLTQGGNKLLTKSILKSITLALDSLDEVVK